LTTCAALTLVMTPAMAQETSDTLVIAGASATGGYFSKAQTAAERLSQRGHVAEAVTTNGSQEITLGICSGQFTAGYTQIDAMFARAKEGCALMPVATYGVEYAIMLVPGDSDIGQLSDLGSDNTVLINSEGSGANLFWNTIVSIEQGEEGSDDDWAKAQTEAESFDMANTLAEFGSVDAVVVVASLNSPVFTNLVSVGWEAIELWDKDINDQEFNGESLYASEKIKGTIGGSSINEWGYEVRSFGVVTVETRQNRDLFSDLAAALR